MSTVFLADDERMSRKVCVKIPHPSFLAEPGFRERFTREVQSLTRMEHPHVVKVHDAGEYRGLPYAVLQYLGGGSLRGRFAWHGGTVPPEDVLQWLPAVAGALQYLHDHGLVHRDVKPTNILFDEQGHAFVADFGIAKALGEREAGLTQTGQTPGSPEYMAPEVVTGGELGPAYDQYALGVVVYVALSGRFPFEGKTPLQMLLKKRTDRPVPLGRYAPELPAGVAMAVMRAIDRDPARRFPSCTAFSEAYARGLEAATTAVPSGNAVPAPRTAPARRFTGIAVAAGVAVLAAGALFAWRPWEKATPPAPGRLRDRRAEARVVAAQPRDRGFRPLPRRRRSRGRRRRRRRDEVAADRSRERVTREGRWSATLSLPADGRYALTRRTCARRSAHHRRRDRGHDAADPLRGVERRGRWLGRPRQGDGRESLPGAASGHRLADHAHERWPVPSLAPPRHAGSHSLRGRPRGQRVRARHAQRAGFEAATRSRGARSSTGSPPSSRRRTGTRRRSCWRPFAPRGRPRAQSPPP